MTPAGWHPLSAGSGRYRGVWAATTAYLANDLVTFAGLLLSRIADGMSGATIDLAQWTVVGTNDETVRWKVGRYYTQLGSQGASALTYQTLHTVPQPVPANGAIDRLAVEVTAAGAATAAVTLLVYADDGGYPGALLLNGGTVAADAIAVKEAVVARTPLPAGRVFLAVLNHMNVAAPQLRRSTTGQEGMGCATATDALQTATVGWSIPGIAAVPNPFPAGALVSNSLTRLAVRAA